MLVGFTIRHQRRSGIHRVIVETARALSGLVALDLVRWDPSAGALRFLDAAETDALFGPGDWPAGVRLRPTARRVGGAFWSEVGDLADAWLLAPEVAWHEADGNRILAEVVRQCRERGLRTAALCYDLIPIRNPLYREGAEPHQAYLRELAQCDLVLPISRDCAAQLTGWWREQGVAPPPATAPLLLPDGGFTHGATAPRAAPQASVTPWIVLLGTVEPRKRQLAFLEAMAQARTLSAEVARYEAVVVGSLQPLVADAFKGFLADNPWVRYLDYASDATVTRLLGGARFTVFASDDEGYGLPIAESLAAGTPCLCADFGAMGEIAVGGGCLAVDVRSQAALSQAVTRLCEQPAELARLRAEIAVRPFRSWRDYASAMLAQMASLPAPTVLPGVSLAPSGETERADGAGGPILRVVAAPWRLALAMRRNGLGPVFQHLARTLRRRGALGALRLAFAGRARRAALADAPAAPATGASPAPRGPADLDETYAMSVRRWALWAGDLEAADAGPATEEGADAEVSFIIAGPADGPETRNARRATQAAVAGLGVCATVLGEHDPHPTPDRWVVFLRPGDRPLASFARELARATRDGIAEVASFDMVRRTDGGDVQPLFAPGANPTQYRRLDSLFGRIAVRAGLLADSSALGEIDPRAVVLDWLDRTPPAQARGRWRHVGRPVLEAVVSDDEVASLRQAARLEGRRATASTSPPAAAVIAMPAGAGVPDALIRDLLRRSPDEVAAVVIVTDGSTAADALAALDTLAREPRVRVLRREGRADRPQLYLLGAADAPADAPLLFLDADLAPASEDWLERLAARLHASPEVGAVGPLLLGPDAKVLSAGLYLRPRGAGHALRGAASGAGGYPFLLDAARETSGLSGLALMTRREVFAALGGFDAQLGAALFDVDYGRRVDACGWTNVFEPAAVLVGGDRVSRAGGPGAIRGDALDRYDARWAQADSVDRLYPAGFDLRDETLRRLAVPDRPAR